ncbi:DUF1735 domain-containing protein [Chitinophaga sp. 212800010-3]|uniref:BT_3987 domain-containing protein n=1 Tax=unclassified Chitinophaga TaxID=2619133 RepID=UPI002DED5ABA|nr:hypothetical protein [Chitinophaga sp. 212800010-3]
MKKERLKHIRSLLLMAGFLWGMTACKKDTFNTDGLFAYTPAGTVSADTWKQDYVMARSGIFPVNKAGFPVLLTRAFKSDVQVTARIDTSLIATYDSINNITSARPQPGTFVLSGTGSVTIKAGQTTSADSIVVMITDPAKIDPSRVYTVPVVLNIPEDGVPLSSNRKTMFVRVAFKTINVGLNGYQSGNTIPLTINRTPAGDVFTPQQAQFGATLNTKFSANLSVGVTVDNTLIDAYNTSNKTSAVAFPAGTYNLLQQLVNIPAGAVTSTDTFNVAPLNSGAFTPGKTYLLPIRIKDEGPVAADPKNNAVYVSLTVKLQNIDPANGKVTGNQVARTGWNAIVSSTESYYSQASAAAAFDGDYATGWQSKVFGDNTPVFTLDMGSAHSVKGFSFTPMYWNFYGSTYISAPTTMTVYSSTDGVNWTAQGDFSGTAPQGSTTNPDFRYIKFYQSVDGRYFRFVVTKYSGYAAGLGELQAFE